MQLNVFAETSTPQPLSPPSVEITANLEEWTISVVGSNFPDGIAHIFLRVEDSWITIASTINSYSINGGNIDVLFDLYRSPSFALGVDYEVSVHIPGVLPQGVVYDFPWSLPAIATTSLPGGTVGITYSQMLSDDGGSNVTLDPQLVWSVPSGTLPPGLTLNEETGAITGTPTAAGTFNFEIRLGNEIGLENSAETIQYTRNFSITIAPAGTTTTHNVTIINGGTGSEVVGGGANRIPGSAVSINAGTRVNYVFNGWTFSPANIVFIGGMNASSANTMFVMPNQNVVATANWTATTTPPNGGGGNGGGNGGVGGDGTGNWAGGGGGGGATFATTAPGPAADMITGPIADVARELHRLFMIGDDMGNFRPASPITRAEAATILARVHVLDFETGFNVLPADMDVFDTFVDVNSGNWFYYYVAWAYSAGLIQGDAVTDGARTFRPNDPITRQEFAAILARTADSIAAGNLPFADSDAIAGWARDYVSTTYTLGWMIGDEFNNVNPASNISRAEVATAISRMLGRIADRAGYDMADITNLHNAIDFPDVSMLAWYYPASLSATNDHYIVRNVSGAVIMKEFAATR